MNFATLLLLLFQSQPVAFAFLMCLNGLHIFTHSSTSAVWLRDPAALVGPCAQSPSAGRTAAIPESPKSRQKAHGFNVDNRGLRTSLAVCTVRLASSPFIYWAQYAAEQNGSFSSSVTNLRTRRLSESTLQGWMIGRAVGPTPAYHERDSVAKSGVNTRWTKPWPTFRLGPWRSGAGARVVWRSKWCAARSLRRRQRQAGVKGNEDVRLTIDRCYSKAAMDQLRKHGAVVAVNPQNGESGALWRTILQLERSRRQATGFDSKQMSVISRWLVSTRPYYILVRHLSSHDMAFLAGEQDTSLLAAAVATMRSGQT